jgi:hypothetical protein
MDGLLQVYRLVLALCGVGLLVSSAEYWSIAGCFAPGGIYSWSILRLRFGLPVLFRIASFDSSPVRTLLVLRGITLVLLFAEPIRSLWFSGSLLLLIGATVVLSWRMGVGEEGSDRMNSIVLVAILLCVGPQSTPFLLRAGLWFIALQACLSYATSGLAKLASPTWRQGDALLRILSTETYGCERLARLLQQRRWLQSSLCWSVILVETLFPLALVLPAPWAWVFLGGGIVFHLLCAAIMGFNSFLWAFGATYPAIVYASTALSRSPAIERVFAGVIGW